MFEFLDLKRWILVLKKQQNWGLIARRRSLVVSLGAKVVVVVVVVGQYAKACQGT